MSKLFTLQVQGIQVTISNNDYISLTDIAKYKSNKSGGRKFQVVVFCNRCSRRTKGRERLYKGPQLLEIS